MFDITNQLLTRHAFRAFCATLPCWRINSKALTILNLMFSRIMAASKTLKNWIRIAYRHCRSKLPRRGRRPNWREEKPKVTYSVALVKEFLAAENGNRLLPAKDCHKPILAVYLKNFFSVVEEKVSYWEFCKLKFMPIVCFCNDSTHFPSWAFLPTHFTTLFLRLWTLFFSSINKDVFFCQYRAI